MYAIIGQLFLSDMYLVVLLIPFVICFYCFIVLLDQINVCMYVCITHTVALHRLVLLFWNHHAKLNVRHENI